MAGKLTEVQQATLDSCISLDVAWVTGIGSENDLLLREWTKNGWAEEAEPPARSKMLVAYRITPAGRRSIEENGR